VGHAEVPGVEAWQRSSTTASRRLTGPFRSGPKADQIRHRKNRGIRGGRRSSARSTTGGVAPSSAASTGSKRHRAVATRFDKLAVRHEATLHIATINDWLLTSLCVTP
jgi:hypothetical protein